MVATIVQFAFGAIFLFFSAVKLRSITRYFLWDIVDLLATMFLLFFALLGLLLICNSIMGVFNV
jgi:hypothetical protein